MTADQRARLEAYAREKLDENWHMIRRASDEGSKALLLLLIEEVYCTARAEGLNDGARAEREGAAIGRAPVPEAAYPSNLKIQPITT